MQRSVALRAKLKTPKPKRRPDQSEYTLADFCHAVTYHQIRCGKNKGIKIKMFKDINDSPYFGEPNIQALQKNRDEQVEDLRDLPGAVIHARTFSVDDPEAIGWQRIKDVVAKEGIVTFRGADESVLSKARKELAEFDPSEHYWDIFMADAATIRDVCSRVASMPLPAGLVRMADDSITAKLARQVQHFLNEHGVSPFSIPALLGQLFDAKLVVLTNSNDQIAAAGFAAMTHNRHSPFAGTAWVGLIAVDPALRGMGLGKQVDAICNLAAVDELGASATMEFVARDNIPSRAMLEGCGLRHVEGKSVAMFSRSADRITR